MVRSLASLGCMDCLLACLFFCRHMIMFQWKMRQAKNATLRLTVSQAHAMAVIIIIHKVIDLNWSKWNEAKGEAHTHIVWLVALCMQCQSVQIINALASLSLLRPSHAASLFCLLIRLLLLHYVNCSNWNAPRYSVSLIRGTPSMSVCGVCTLRQTRTSTLPLVSEATVHCTRL